MFKPQPLLLADSYKLGHCVQYPEGTQYIYSNFTPRSNGHFAVPEQYKVDQVVFFGLQATILEMHELWYEQFFERDVEESLGGFYNITRPFLGDNKFSLKLIRDLHEIGYLPVKIKALPEGSRVNIGVPLFTITNTDPRFYWLTNYLETYLSAESWKMITVATIADRYKAILIDYAEQTGGSMDFVNYQGHDFSTRGMSSMMDAIKSCSGHALSFKGSDNIHAVPYLQYYYYADDFVFCSVPASEHSVMCAGGQDNEVETIRRLIQDIYPSGPVSVVSDSWDFWNVITNTAKELKQIILDRGTDSNGISKVIFRPDSGDPVKIICGENIQTFTKEQHSEGWVEDYLETKVQDQTPHGIKGPNKIKEIVKIGDKFFEVELSLFWGRYDKVYYYLDDSETISFEEVESKPEYFGAVDCLWDIFGGTINDKGYKTLNQKVGLIYGDSITLQRAADILKGLKSKGFASDNIVFGIGSYTYQYNTRDTLGMAMKATWAVINNEEVEIFKNPKTDNGTKKSAKGLLRVEREGKGFILHDQQTRVQESHGELKTVYCDGEFIRFENLNIIKDRLRG